MESKQDVECQRLVRRASPLRKGGSAWVVRERVTNLEREKTRKKEACKVGLGYNVPE